MVVVMTGEEAETVARRGVIRGIIGTRVILAATRATPEGIHGMHEGEIRVVTSQVCILLSFHSVLTCLYSVVVNVFRGWRM